MKIERTNHLALVAVLSYPIRALKHSHIATSEETESFLIATAPPSL